MKLIERRYYLDKLISVAGTPISRIDCWINNPLAKNNKKLKMANRMKGKL